jgi:hypothetical protein
MNERVLLIASVLRGMFDRAHHEALTSTGVSDLVFKVQDTAIEMADRLMRTSPEFDRQAFLSVAIDQPGITNAWDQP